MRSIIIDKERLQQTIANGESLVLEEQRLLLDTLKPKSTILEIESAGHIAEYLATNGQGHKVTLCSDDRLCFVFRNQIIPDSEVTYINVSYRKIIVSQPVYDYVIIHDLSHLNAAMTLAKIGIINNVTGELMEVGNKSSRKKSKNIKEEQKNDNENQSAEPITSEDIESNGDVLESQPKEPDDIADVAEPGSSETDTDIPVADTKELIE